MAAEDNIFTSSGSNVFGLEAEAEENTIIRSNQRNSNNKPPSAPRKCKNCGLTGHYVSTCPTYNGPRKPPKEVRCTKCKLEGHYHTTCGGDTTYKHKHDP